MGTVQPDMPIHFSELTADSSPTTHLTIRLKCPPQEPLREEKLCSNMVFNVCSKLCFQTGYFFAFLFPYVAQSDIENVLRRESMLTFVIGNGLMNSEDTDMVILRM